MQFLLLLSALLSAVTGAFAVPRAESAPVDQVAAPQVAAAPAQAAMVALAVTPLPTRPAPGRNDAFALETAQVTILPAPLASVRRQE